MSHGIYKKIFLFIFAISFLTVFEIGSAYGQGNYQAQGNSAAQARTAQVANMEESPAVISANEARDRGEPMQSDLIKIPDTVNQYKFKNGGLPNTIFIMQKQSNGTYEVTGQKVTQTDGTVKETDQKTVDEKAQEERVRAEAKERGEEEVLIACPGLWWGTLGENVLCLGAKISYFLILSPSNRLFNLTGKAFDYVVDLAVVNMKSTLGICSKNTDGTACSDNKKNVINTGWILFRDIANILFIFILIYASIKTIIGGISETGSMIGNVIIIAVLINFSMFFTKVVIDVSNTLAISFYNSIQTYSDRMASKPSTSNSDDELKSVLSPLLKKALIQSIIIPTQDSVNKGSQNVLNYTMIIKQSLIGTIFILTITFIMATMTVMLLVRVVLLGFIIMLSALAFAAYILPDLRSKITDKWWSALVGQSFFAPVFLLLLYISMQFMSAFTEPGTDLNNILGKGGQAAPAVIQFVMVIALMVISMRIAKSMADQAGGITSKVTGMVGKMALGAAGLAGGLTLGGAAMATRATVGRAAASMASSQWASRLANTQDRTGWMSGVTGGIKRGIGRTAMRTGDAVASSSLDIRNAPGMSVTQGVLGAAGGEGGYRQGIQNQAERVQARAERVAQPTQAELNEKAAKNREVTHLKLIMDNISGDDDVAKYEKIINDNKDKLADARQALSSLEKQDKLTPGGVDPAKKAAAIKLVADTEQEIKDAGDKRKARRNFLATKFTNHKTSKGHVADFKTLKDHIEALGGDVSDIEHEATVRQEQDIQRYETSAVSHVTSGLNRGRVSSAIRNS